MIKWSEFIKSAADESGWIDDEIPEVLFVGRSNVGKSSFINALTNNKKLAKISSTPGKTRLLNFFDINKHQFRIVDAPGYGFAQITNQQRAEFSTMMEQYLANRTNLKLVLMLLDLRREPSNDDLLMYDYLRHYGIPVIFIGTKLDKLKKNEIKKNENLIRSTLDLDPEQVMIKISNTENKNVEQVYLAICNFLNVEPVE